ncbi:MAG: SurA N-terminal domain-containing protein [Tannerellaceae bacterium]|nr:SurA N-terminal domain-containing protein [Tannerellaceae bacterium]
MATLEKIRNKAGLLVIVVGIALFAFIIGDFLNSGSTFFRQTQEKIASVDGEVITIQQYQQRIDEMTEVYKSQTGSASVPEEVMINIRQSVFDSMVQEIVMDEATSKLGLTVSPDELFDMIQGENISPVLQQMGLFTDPQTGMIDKKGLLEFLQTIHMDDAALRQLSYEQQESIIRTRQFWLFIEKNIQRERLEQKYTTLLSKAVSYNKLDAKASFDESAESADIAFAMQSYSSIPDSTVNVSDNEAKKLYEQRKDSYKQKEAKQIKYIAVDIRPSQEDYNQVSREMEAVKEDLQATADVALLVNDRSDKPFVNAYASAATLTPEVRQFAVAAEIGEIYGPFFEDNKYNLYKLVDKTVGPDSLDIAHILLPRMDNQPFLINIVDSLVTELRNGTDFAQVAGEYSMDQQSSMMGGQLGWVTETMVASAPAFGEEFKNQLFANPSVNQILVVNSPSATHIVKINGKTSNVTKYKVADVEIEVSPSSRTYGDLYNELNQFLAKNQNMDKWEEAAKEAGYNVLTARVSANDQNVGIVRNSRQVVRWAFQNGKGKVSEIIDCGDTFVVAAMEGTIKEGYRSFESVKNSLKSELIAQKKGEIISKELKDKNLSSLEAYASAMDSKVDTVRFVSFNTRRITNIGVEPKLNAAIAAASLNQVSQPVAGNNGVYVFEVFNKNQDMTDFNEAEQVRSLDASNYYRFGFQAIQSLINKADVEDNRIRFY